MDKKIDKLGERIKQALKVAKLQYKEIADLLDTAESTISHHVTGRSKPSIDQVKIYAKACGVTLDWLLTGEGDMHNTPYVAEPGVEYGNNIMERIDNSTLPEPAKRSIKMLVENEDMAWELYAVMMERIQKARDKKEHDERERAVRGPGTSLSDDRADQ